MMRRSSIDENRPSHKLLIQDEDARAFREAQNGLRQFDEVMRIVRDPAAPRIITAPVVKRLQWLAIDGIYSSAGFYRDHPVYILNSEHRPPPHQQVPELVDEMCAYVNQPQHSALHVASFLMWRLNWIHPFGEGNGRTSRAVSYLGLSLRLQMELPGNPTIPDLIVRERQPYYSALDAADAAWSQSGIVDVREMDSLLENLFRRQLQSVVPG